ncbi:MAG TPA: endonuclease VIII [Gammaproteobacteria bacterium]|nr:endonuclease VIII [Gammaproteobacteria bacterium]
MPEGPEIRRAADRLEKTLCGKGKVKVWFAFPRLKRFERQLEGACVAAVETFGKAILTRFDNALNIYSHNQLYGRWYCCNPDDPPRTSRQLRLAIHTDSHSALLYSASEIEVLENSAVATHPFISRIGPDLLSPQTTLPMVMERLRERGFRNRQLGRLLTEQSFVAGLGNYLRCEILFVTGLAPSCRPADLDSGQLEQLARAMLHLPRQSYQTGGITNHLPRARKMLAEGSSFEDARFHVFRRAGKPCYRCGAAIQRSDRGGQTTWFCPRCQKGAAPASGA